MTGPLTIALAALAALAVRPAANAPDVPADVPLGELRAEPARHLGKEVRFTVQFSRPVEDWNPFFSRFGPREWLALEVWPDESFMWDREAFEDPARRVFVRRGSDLESLVQSARTYTRFEAQGIVREIFLGQPWIEIVRLKPLAEEVGEGTIVHVGRARELWAQGQWDMALEQLERAKVGPLPPHALHELELQMLECRAAREAAARRR